MLRNNLYHSQCIRDDDGENNYGEDFFKTGISEEQKLKSQKFVFRFTQKVQIAIKTRPMWGFVVEYQHPDP